MYILSRWMLLLAVVLYAYCAVLISVIIGWPAVAVLLLLVAVLASRKGRRLLTACGTGAWASARELERAGILGATKGLILGRIPTEGTPIGQAVKALLNPRLGAWEACSLFWDNLRRRERKQGRLVRLPHAVHTMVVAPTGVGKGVSFVIPFLLTCEESCVVVDFKGELALLTAEHRRRMGHEVIILDPFKMVTQ
jgi:type IV secretion system protein VirD4